MEVSKINGYDIKDKKAIRTYDTVALMKADNTLKEGQHVKTKGYYQVNDGGCGEYYISTQSNLEFQESLDNNLYASLVLKDNTINIKQLGAKNMSSDNMKYDIKNYITSYINHLDYKEGLKLYIPSGIWYLSDLNITRNEGFYIYGDERFTIQNKNATTTICSLSNNQDYILKIGDENNTVTGWTLKNLCFTSSDYIYSDSNLTRNGYKDITSCLSLEHATFGITDNLFFDFIKGNALKISSSFENYFNLLNFRHVNAMGTGVLIFDDISVSESNENISATNFNKIMGEALLGDFILVNENANLTNSSINNLNFEGWTLTPSQDYVFTNITTETYNDFTHWGIFNVKGRCDINVNNLELNNFGFRYLTYNEIDYCYDTIINVTGNDSNPNMNINNINIAGMSMDCPIINQNNYYLHTPSNLSINNVSFLKASHKLYFGLTGAKSINCNTNNLNGATSRDNIYNPINLNTVNPCYKNSNKYTTHNYGVLYYDSNTLNDLNLAVKPYFASSGDGDVRTLCMSTLVTGTNFLLRAKFPADTSVVLSFFYDNSNSFNMTFEGTGNYETYIKENVASLEIGKPVGIRLATAQAGKECYLDYYKFY